jgi:dihydrofolate reductase
LTAGTEARNQTARYPETAMPAAHTLRAGLPPALRFAGHAIVSADGMISAADGTMPPTLHNEADWRHFQAALDAAVLVVLGRIGHRIHSSRGRPRLVLTSLVENLAPDPEDAHAHFYNPAGMPLAAALARLGVERGTVAVTGGTRVFEAFLPLYDAFDLAEINGMVLPGGRPCFASGHPRAVLAAAGLRPAQFDLIDAEAGVSLTHWVQAGG